MSDNILTCLIIDDEPMAQELMEKYIRKIPYLRLIGRCDNAMDALLSVHRLLPDLIFLDIEMPGMTGFELIKLLTVKRPSIIMITADPSYAVEGFEQQVSDYLLKPVSFERFLRAVNKVVSERSVAFSHYSSSISQVQNLVQSETLVQNTEYEDISHFLILKEDKKLVRIDFAEIMYVEGMKVYLKLFWGSQVSIVHMTMSKMEDTLPKNQFLRVHRSYIVDKKAIRHIEGTEITTKNGSKIPIGVTYKEQVVSAFQKHNII